MGVGTESFNGKTSKDWVLEWCRTEVVCGGGGDKKCDVCGRRCVVHYHFFYTKKKAMELLKALCKRGMSHVAVFRRGEENFDSVWGNK